MKVEEVDDDRTVVEWREERSDDGWHEGSKEGGRERTDGRGREGGVTRTARTRTRSEEEELIPLHIIYSPARPRHLGKKKEKTREARREG